MTEKGYGQKSGKHPHYMEIDLCRGIGIFLVVLGHAIKQVGKTEGILEVILSVIYSFHMPLFFILSGFVSVKILEFSDWSQRVEYVKNRAFRLLIPYFTVGILYMPVKFILSKYAVKAYDFSAMWKLFLGENPDVALWFLYFLFWISALCACVLRRKNLNVWLGISFAVSALTYGFAWDLRLFQYTCFFLLGIWLRLHYEKVQSWLYSGKVLFAAGVLFIGGNLGLYLWEVSLLQIVTALSGSFLSLAAAQRFKEREHKEDSSICRKAVYLLGKYSMDVYILSEPVQTAVKIASYSILGLPANLCILLCFLLGIFIPIPVSLCIVRKVKLFRIGILGIRS